MYSSKEIIHKLVSNYSNGKICFLIIKNKKFLAKKQHGISNSFMATFITEEVSSANYGK